MWQRHFFQYLELFFDPPALYALLTWPKFSFTAYKMISALYKQGIYPQTVIDVGANYGQFAVAAAKIWPATQLYAFEPLPQATTALQILSDKIENITIHPVALGDREGEIPFHVNTYSHASSCLPLAEAHQISFPYAQTCETISVNITTLDHIFANKSLNPPILLKLDVQGYESITLQGGKKFLEKVDFVLLETSYRPLYQGELLFREILSLMESHGFSFLRPVSFLSSPRTGEILQMDALFTR